MSGGTLHYFIKVDDYPVANVDLGLKVVHLRAGTRSPSREAAFSQTQEVLQQILSAAGGAIEDTNARDGWFIVSATKPARVRFEELRNIKMISDDADFIALLRRTKATHNSVVNVPS